MQALGFQKLTIFGIFNKLLSTQNANVARYARNVELRFFVIFKHCDILLIRNFPQFCHKCYILAQAHKKPKLVQILNLKCTISIV